MDKKVYEQHENTGVAFDTPSSWINTKEPEYPPSNVDMAGYQTLPELIDRCLRLGENPLRMDQREYEFGADEDVTNAYDVGDDVDLSDFDNYVPSVIGDAPDFSYAVQKPAQEATGSVLEAVDDKKVQSTVKEETATSTQL